MVTLRCNCFFFLVFSFFFNNASAFIGADGPFTRSVVYGPKSKICLSAVSEEAVASELDALSKQWKKKRITREYEESKLLGFTAQSEIINGRFAAFFIVVGLLTEAFSGESIPQQVETMLETFGIIGLS